MAQFYPSGMLGVGLTALMASFMSGMAGNVTAFNTVFTYDIYQSYIRKNASGRPLSDGGPADHHRRHRCCRSRRPTWPSYNNIMDLLQLVFGFVNAPLFATFLLGMFWKRATGHGAFFGLLAGTGAAALTRAHAWPKAKGGYSRPFTLFRPPWRRISGSPSSPGVRASSRHPRKFRDHSPSGFRTDRAGLRAHRTPYGRGSILVPAARHPGSDCRRCSDSAEYLVPIKC